DQGTDKGPWTRNQGQLVLINRSLLDHEPWPRAADRASLHAERQRHRGRDGVAGRKADDDRPRKVREQLCHHGARGWIARWLVAFRQLADDESRRACQEARLAELRHHAIEAIGTLADFVEKQQVARRRVERERCPE